MADLPQGDLAGIRDQIEMTRLRVALLVADPARDLPGTVLTAYELCQRGATCFVIPVPPVSARAEIFSLAPDYVLMPAVRPYPLALTFQLATAGIQFGFIETETPYESSFNDFLNPIRKDTDLRDQISCVCCWSRATAEELNKERLFDRGQLMVSGCPQFDYHTAPLSQVYTRNGSTRVQRDERDQVVLISTNFTLANPRHELSGWAIDSCVRTYGYEMEQVTRWFGNEVRAVDEMADLANRVAADFPNARIIFRPDCEEQNYTYRSKLAKLPNLRLTTRGSLLSWTARSSAVVQGGRIDAINAYLMRVPVLSPKWISAGAEPLEAAVSIPCFEYLHLRRVLEEVLSGNFTEAEAERRKAVAVIESAFQRLDGLAHKRVADAIIETMRLEIRPNLKKCRGLLSLIADQRSSRIQGSANADDPIFVSFINQLVGAIASAKHAEHPRNVSTSSANKGGAYVSYQYRGRAVVMICGSAGVSV